jgi:hypothetical protein
MPVNFEQLRPQILQTEISLGLQTKERNAQLQEACDFFHKLASDGVVIDRLQKAFIANPGKQCAIPTSQPIDGSYSVDTTANQEITVLAADGSQISPNRHEAVYFGLINAAVFIFRTHSAEIPSIVTETTLIHPELENQSDYEVDENMIALQRDIAERKLLAKEACQIDNGKPVIALIDGPLEIFNIRQSFQVQKRLFKEYQSAIRQLSQKNIITAGYIDRPRADYVIRMLNILADDQSQSEHSGFSRYPLICDSDIFSAFLQPGERSSLFRLDSKIGSETKDSIEISFFYLNIGKTRQPVIARIEIPSWTAQNYESINLLHACILEQTGILRDNPYPYVLHRAHESALIQFSEKDRITKLMVQNLSKQEKTFFQKSNKLTLKDMSNKKISIES